MNPLTQRRAATVRPLTNLMEWFSNDPFFQSVELKPIEDGNLAVDVSENGEEVLVRASLPGFRKENIDVQVHGGVLTIKAEQTEESEIRDEKFYRRERHFGSVARRIELPGVVADADAKAEFKDGVLTIRVPQTVTAKPKRIAIK